MNKDALAKNIIVLLALALASATNIAQEHHEEHEHNEEEHSDHVEIETSMATAMGVVSKEVRSGVIQHTLLVYGKTVPDPQQLSHVTARYPGLIRHIGPRLGDTVEVGELIATIEANSSLQEYEIFAPLSGTVVDKHANLGELATAQPLLTIANYASLWVDLTLFPGDFAHIDIGMPVTIRTDFLSAQSNISYLNPSKGDSPTVIARVPLPNPERDWVPGLLIEGEILLEEVQADIAVKNTSIQEFEGSTVVFVQEGEVYTPRPIVTGRADSFHTQVLSGLTLGERYVTENSYLIKADLLKEGTQHSH